MADLQEEMTQHTITKDYADVLLIVTGGTLCMINTENGYVAAPGLAERLKRNEIFYDKQHADQLGLDSSWLVTPETPFGKRIRSNPFKRPVCFLSNCRKHFQSIEKLCFFGFVFYVSIY